MVIDIAHMSHVRPELRDHRPNPQPRLARINRAPSQPRLTKPSGRGLEIFLEILLEINVWHKMAVVRSRLAARISHRKQRDLMSLRTHQLHGFEQVDLGAAEGIVIFVAIQNFHGKGSNPDSPTLDAESYPDFDFAFLSDLRESFAHFAVKGFCSAKLGHHPR